MLAGALVEVGAAPRVERHGLPEVGASPVERDRVARGYHLQGREPLFGRRVRAVVEPVVVESEAEELDLRARGGALRLRDAAQNAWPHERGEQAEHDDHDQDLDEGEPV